MRASLVLVKGSCIFAACLLSFVSPAFSQKKVSGDPLIESLSDYGGESTVNVSPIPFIGGLPDFGWCNNGHDTGQCGAHGGTCSSNPDWLGQTHCQCGGVTLSHKKCCSNGQIVNCGGAQAQ